ncbi:hypothetical protein CC1G_07859 [Coprinopsis cinerea okayama7|uniref:HMG box domain-containing protein n=1 Tax=Coprinopsis cinerea (strain Okayama-7 / 130 / ATCC MYA-4618 / FGSC 9003) TaxID=240176 RepID=A8P433_COPC7|nr:hypothetical protein CC1G_07859 [Coprinopsis cinerea okayama7\|eukprot:XP_001838668.2 hypothetical protein CC1G_07859 [Coprinopsis cinerea okayama7\
MSDDPGKTKRLNAFILFRTEKSKQYPGVRQARLSKLIGDRWNRLPEAAKNRWRNYARNGGEPPNDDDDSGDAERENKRPNDATATTSVVDDSSGKCAPGTSVPQPEELQKPSALADKGKKPLRPVNACQEQGRSTEKTTKQGARTASKEQTIDAAGPSPTEAPSATEVSIASGTSSEVPPVHDEPNYSAFLAEMPPAVPSVDKSLDLDENTVDELQEKAAKGTIYIPPIPGVATLTHPGPYQIIPIHEIDNHPYKVVGLTTRAL